MAQCRPEFGTGFLDFYLRITSSVNGDVNYGYIDEVDGGSTSPVAGGTALSAGSPFDLPDLYSNPAAHRFEGQFVYHNPSRVITVTFNGAAYEGGNHFCQVTGTAVPASTNCCALSVPEGPLTPSTLSRPPKSTQLRVRQPEGVLLGSWSQSRANSVGLLAASGLAS